MRADFKRLGKGTLIYGLGGVLNRFIGFLLLPLFTAYLTPAEYGIAAILGLITLIVVPIFSLGFGASMAPCYFEGSDLQRKAATVWTSVSILLLSAAVLVAAGVLVPDHVSRLAFGTPGYARLVTLTLASAACSVMYEPLNLYLRFEERARDVVVLSLIAALASIAVNVWLVVVLRRGITGLVIGGLVGQALTFALYLIPAIRAVPFRLDRKAGAELLRVGLPMVPSFAFVFILQQSNKYILQWFRGLDAVGVYNIGFNLGMAMSMAVTAFQSAWLPFFMSFVDRKDEARVLFGRVLTYYVFGFGLLALLFFIAARPVVMIMTQPPFHGAYKVVGCAAFAEFLRGVFLILLPGMYFAREVPFQSLVQAVAAAAALALNFALIPVAGVLGAALALPASFAIQAVLLVAWNKRRTGVYLPVQYEWRRALPALGLYVVGAAIFLLPRGSGLRGEIFLSVAAAFAAAAVLFLLLSADERQKLMGFVSATKR